MKNYLSNLDVDSEVATLSEDELRCELTRYKRFSHGSGYGFWEWSLETEMACLRGELWGQLGYSAEHIATLNDSKKVLSLVHPDDIHGVRFNLRSQLKYGVPLILECRVRTADEHYVWTQVRANSVTDGQGKVRLISGIVFDITALKRAEESLRDARERQERIITASNDGMWEWDAREVGFHFSSRCWEHIGYDSEDVVISPDEDRWKVWRSLMHPDDLPKFDRALMRHYKYQEPFDIEYRIYTKSGDLRWVRARGKASYDSNGAPLRMSGTNMDITSLKRAEERVMLAKEVAEKANHAKSDFLSSMSHELRTPLNAILGFVQLFDYESNLTNEQMQNIQDIRKAGQHLMRLIGDVLDLSKIEAGHMSVSLEPVLISRVLKECFTLLQPLAEAKGVRVECIFNDLDTSYITADVIRIKQVLLNLMSNGIKYNRAGGELIISFSERKYQTSQYLRLEIRDNGLGIAKSKQNEVFQPFNRLGAEDSGIEGSGVGLVITKQLVEIMKGLISFESFEDIGSVFWIDFPVVSLEDLTRGGSSGMSSERAQKLTIKGQYQILYIEDNPLNIRLMVQIFDRFDCLTLEVADESFQGLFKARTMNPDVVILDINLPGLDGFEVLKVLQQDEATKNIPVMALSANAMPFDVERGLEAGFVEYLTKPVDIERLMGTLNRLLD